jgi:hypothetical protein
MGARLFVVSNRVVIPGQSRKPIAGGMAVAVKALEHRYMTLAAMRLRCHCRIMDWDIDTWAEGYLSALVESHSRRRGFDGIRSLIGMMSEQRPLPTERLADFLGLERTTLTRNLPACSG